MNLQYTNFRDYRVVSSSVFQLFQIGPTQAQNLRDSLAEAKSDIVVKVSSSLVGLIYLRLSTDTWENHMD